MTMHDDRENVQDQIKPAIGRSRSSYFDRHKLSRRALLLRTGMLGGAILFGERTVARAEPGVSLHKRRMKGLKRPVRIVQLSDFHRSWCVSEDFLRRVVERTNLLKPDVLLLTGDFVTHSSSYMNSCFNALRDLKPGDGAFAVLGNHDYACDRSTGAPVVAETLGYMSVPLLTNRSIKLDSGLHIVGVDDCWLGRPDPERAFADVPDNEPVVAMTHNPAIFPYLGRYPAITLAGHTHGGQIHIPLLTRELMPGRSRFLRGWFHAHNGPGAMYVSRGLGVVGIPMRFRSDPEIAVFDLSPA